LKWYVQAELVHCRFAMAGVAGILGTDVSFSAELLLNPCQMYLFLVLRNHTTEYRFCKIAVEAPELG
jgi:hypothetical protein